MEIKSKIQKPKAKNPDIRYLNDMKEVLYDKRWVKTAPNLELYYMYREKEKRGDLRYDITIIPPLMLGEEFNKTLGHYHSDNFGEVYEILEGEAIYLMQKGKGTKISDVYATKAKKGEAVIVPRGYGHITINHSGKKIKEGNWLNENCKNIYKDFEKLRGACYYCTKSGWIKNKNYKKVPKLKFKRPLKSLPKNLDFLNLPR